MTFGELLELATRAQSLFRRHGLKPGEAVLLLEPLGPRLYACVIALLAMGASVVLVEPWMPIERINRVIRLVKPKLFVAGLIGQAWGLRLASVREIPTWVNPKRMMSETKVGELHLESVAEDAPGILTFTSGTTGDPKGVVRNQGYLLHQHRILSQALELEKHKGPDLCIFANFALANLASGRGSIIVPPKWRAKDLKWVGALSGEMRPESLTTGPAFLLELMKHVTLPSLESIHVGGALTDCWIFEKAFSHFPQAHVLHIYGSSEAEPVALADAHEAVQRSRARGYFQTLFVGQPIADIEAEIQSDNLWVTGPHVCPLYVGGEEENRKHKRRDERGRVWHSMGDRIRADGEGWWYSGRSQQSLEAFELEQRVYAALGSSKAFVLDEGSSLSLCVEPDENLRDETYQKLKNTHPRLDLFEVKISRDRRHRARIDRAASLRTRKPWQTG